MHIMQIFKYSGPGPLLEGADRQASAGVERLTDHANVVHNVRLFLDGLSVAATIGSMAQILPPIASLLSIIWLSIQIGTWVVKKIKGK